MNSVKAGKGVKAGIAPYLIVLTGAVYLYYKTTQFGFEAPGGRIGPDAWPRIVLGLLMLVCIYEVARRLIFRGANADRRGLPQPAAESTAEPMTAEALAVQALDPGSLAADPTANNEDVHPSYPWVLAAGVAMTIAYVALLGVIGFFLCTALYLAGFIRLGGYRRLSVTLVASLLGSLAFMFMFMRVVYVSLPLGVEPFSQLSFLLMRLMGIR